MALCDALLMNPEFTLNSYEVFEFLNFQSKVIVELLICRNQFNDSTLQHLLYFPIEIKLVNNRYAPGTPAGNSRNQEYPL